MAKTKEKCRANFIVDVQMPQFCETYLVTQMSHLMGKWNREENMVPLKTAWKYDGCNVYLKVKYSKNKRCKEQDQVNF